MAKIVKLSPQVANMIAAGEVVERPGSVIKELIENSIDAEATSITVEIKNGGMTYMRVTDNGCGMSCEDAKNAFLRHATSKLRDERGLEAIETLGFRGEALAAISAVSRVTMKTREKNSSEGICVTVEAGKVIEEEPTGCPEGTTTIVRDLFFNTPARLKFMKTDRAEGANISSVVLKCALSHPEISIRYIKDGKEEYYTPGDNKIESCIYSLFGKEFMESLVKAWSESEDTQVTGYVTMPVHSRGNRSYQFFYVNGRYVKSQLLQTALERAYKNSLLTGRFPACILYISIKPGLVDVNVHPAKTEIKFLNEKKAFNDIYYAVLNALGGEYKRAEIQLSGSTKNVLSRASEIRYGSETPNKDNTTTLYSTEKGIPAKENKKNYCTPYEADISYIQKEKREQNNKKEYALHDSGSLEYVRTGSISENKKVKNENEKDNYTTPGYNWEKSVSDAENNERLFSDKSVRIIGEVFSTYIIAECEDRILLIDKHAAHERILFDKFKKSEWDPMPQMLISPILCRADKEDIEILLENKESFAELGFDIDRFGENTVAVRQIPGFIDQGDIEQLLEEFCEKLRAGEKAEESTKREEILHSVACKAAIKAGKLSQPSELEEIVKRVVSGEIKYCPHGRPVAMEITKNMLDKNFKRIQ